jgi:hypothetical protein
LAALPIPQLLVFPFGTIAFKVAGTGSVFFSCTSSFGLLFSLEVKQAAGRADEEAKDFVPAYIFHSSRQ